MRGFLGQQVRSGIRAQKEFFVSAPDSVPNGFPIRLVLGYWFAEINIVTHYVRYGQIDMMNSDSGGH
jgi:hypothetical protein